MPNEDSTSRKAVRIAMEFERKQGREPIDTQTDAKFKGFDILSFSKDKKDIRAIEVKGTAVKNWGIPDLFENEITRSGKLVATHLYLVKFDENKNFEKLFVIPSAKLSANDFMKFSSYRIKSNFYTRHNKLKDFEVK